MSGKRKIGTEEDGIVPGNAKNKSKTGCGGSISSFASFCCGMCCCDEEQLYHGFLLFCSLFVIISQATILNVYIIAFFRGYRHQAFTYFVFLGDLFVVCVFAVSFLSAYRYNHLRKKLKLDQQSKTQQRIIRKKIEDRIYHSIPWLSRRFGTLPYLPFAWFVYSVFLVFKVGIIFTTYANFFRTTKDNFQVTDFQGNVTNCSSITYEQIKIDHNTDEQDPVIELGPNLLKLAVGSTALVFIIILQAHHNHQDNTAHGGHMLGVCHNISVEVFDSVTLLALLIDRNLNEMKEYNEIWSTFNKPIIILSSLNLVFPTITLFALTLSDFGRRMSKITRLTVTNQALQLLLINIPFLYVRLYLWGKYRQDLSMFVVKNLCYIFLLSHSLYPGMIRMFKECDRKRSKVKDFAKRKLIPNEMYGVKGYDENESQSEQAVDIIVTRLDEVDAVRPTSLYKPNRSSMQEMIPMTDLDYDRTNENADGKKDPIKRRQDSSNIATAAFVESMDVTNPNHRVSTASSSPQTTTGSPSSPKSSSVLESPVTKSSPNQKENDASKTENVEIGRSTRL